MSKTKGKLDINRCIIIGDLRRLNANEKPIKTVRKLAKELVNQSIIEDFKPSTLTSIYSKLYRYELNGFYKKDQKLIDNICKILHVKEDELLILEDESSRKI